MQGSTDHTEIQEWLQVMRKQAQQVCADAGQDFSTIDSRALYRAMLICKLAQYNRASTAKSTKADSLVSEPAMWNIFVRRFSGGTLCLHVHPETTILALKFLVQARIGIDAEQQVLFPSKGVALENSDTLLGRGLTPDSNLHLSVRMRGGKGGFGSLLRAGAKGTATDNEDACRDLSGRRLRVVNAEKKLKEWQAGENSRKSAIQAAREEKERQKAEKREELVQGQLDELRNEQSAVAQTLANAIKTAGQKRPAEEAPKKAPKPKKFRGESDDSASESEEEEEDVADVPPSTSKFKELQNLAETVGPNSEPQLRASGMVEIEG